MPNYTHAFNYQDYIKVRRRLPTEVWSSKPKRISQVHVFLDRFRENACFVQDFKFCSSPHIASYALRISVFVVELYSAEDLIRYTFQRKCYINFILNALEVPFDPFKNVSGKILTHVGGWFLNLNLILFNALKTEDEVHTDPSCHPSCNRHAQCTLHVYENSCMTPALQLLTIIATPYGKKTGNRNLASGKDRHLYTLSNQRVCVYTLNLFN